MKQFIKKASIYAFKLLPLLACILIMIMILKQTQLFEWMLTVYHSFVPVFGGVVIALFLQPFIDKIKKHVSSKLSVCIVYSVIIVFFVVFMVGMIPLLYQQVMDFVEIVPSWLDKLEALMDEYHIAYGSLDDFKEKYMQEGYIIVIDSLRTTMSTLTDYGIAFFTSFFLSLDLDYWKRSAKKVLPHYKRCANFYHTMSNIVYQYLCGTLLDLLFITITVGIVLSLYAFPNALLYAVILAFLNLFPYVGATLGLILIAIVGALSYPTFPWICFGIVWCIQQLESNIIQPVIFNHTMNVRPILSFIFIFIGDALFGVIGVILSPIFASIAQIAIRSYLHAKTSDRVGDWDDIWRDFDEIMKEEQTNNAAYSNEK